MSFHGAVFLIDDTVEEGQENVVAMVPEPAEDDPMLSALYKIRAVIVALDDVSETVNGTKIASAFLELGRELRPRDIAISKAKNVDGFSIGVALPNVDGSKCRNLAKSVMESLRYRFGQLSAHDIRSNLDRVKDCLQQFSSMLGSQSIMHPSHHSLLFDNLVAGIRPSLGVAKRLLSLTSSLQIAEASNDAALTLLPRFAFPIGSCFFRKGLCIHSNMVASDLVDVARFCLVNNVLSKTRHDGSSVFCRQVFSDAFEQRMLSVVTMGQSAICMLFHCTRGESFGMHIDPFCLTDIKSLLLNMDAELLDQIDHDIEGLASLTTLCNSLPSRLVSQQLNKEGVYQTAVVPPKPTSGPSSPTIRRKTLENSPNRVKKLENKRLNIAGNDNCILRFRVVDGLNRFVTESLHVSQDPLDTRITDAFRRAILVIKRRLTAFSLDATCTKGNEKTSEAIKPIVEIKNKHETNAAINQQRYRNFEQHAIGTGTVESALHFRIRSVFQDERTNAFQELGIVVVGRLVPPHHEIYFCFEDTVPQNTVELASQFLWAWI